MSSFAAQVSDFSQPLLEQHDSIRHGPPSLQATDAEAPPLPPQPHVATSSLTGSVTNLCNTIIGAGILALPICYASLGVVLGVALMVFVAMCTYFSLSALVRGAERTQSFTYYGVVKRLFGRRVAQLLRVVLIVNCGGFNVIFLIVITDSISGLTESVPALAQAASSITAAAAPWFSARTLTLTIVTWVFIAPVVSARSLAVLSKASAVSLACAATFDVCTLLLFFTAIARGHWLRFEWTPDKGIFGNTPLEVVGALLAIIPVVMTAFICHFNLHPIQRDLKGYTHERMDAALRITLCICTILYIVVPLAAYGLFGATTQGDVLQNYTVTALAPMVGVALAKSIVLLVKSSNVANLWLCMPMGMWPLRADVTDLMFGTDEISATCFYVLTYTILLVTYIAALMLTSMWQAAAVVGSTAGVVLAFVFPAAVVIKSEPGPWWTLQKLFAWFLCILGVFLAFAGLLTNLLPSVPSPQ